MQVALHSFSFQAVVLQSVHFSVVPPFPLCLFMLLLLLPDIFRDELQSTAGGKKLEGEQFRQRAARLLPSHFHEDPFLSLQDRFFSPASLSLFDSLYICLSPHLDSLSSSPLLLFFYNSQI